MNPKKARVRPLDETAPAGPTLPAPPAPADEPSRGTRPDLDETRRGLAERQRRWFEERERFERRGRAGGGAAETTGADAGGSAGDA